MFFEAGGLVANLVKLLPCPTRRSLHADLFHSNAVALAMSTSHFRRVKRECIANLPAVEGSPDPSNMEFKSDAAAELKLRAD